MASAKICDRCGRFYMNYTRAFELTDLGKRSPFMNVTGVLDLCPGCEASLRAWVDEGIMFRKCENCAHRVEDDCPLQCINCCLDNGYPNFVRKES